MEYPKHIADELTKYDGKSVFYFLKLAVDGNEPTYKFGITMQCGTRVRTHCRKLKVDHIIKLIDCTYDSVMRCVETEFKRYVKSIGVMVSLFENTEILVTKEINKYVDWVERAVATELLKPQPKNNRTKETNKNTIAAQVTALRERFDSHMQEYEGERRCVREILSTRMENERTTRFQISVLSNRVENLESPDETQISSDSTNKYNGQQLLTIGQIVELLQHPLYGDYLRKVITDARDKLRDSLL